MAEPEYNSNSLESTIARLRLKLIDLTARNPLISFKHSARHPRFIRVVDELPNQLYERLGQEQGMKFKSLGHADREPEDERTIEFRRALEAAKLTDKEYLDKMGALGENDGTRAQQRLDDELRKRLRARLAMSPRPDASNVIPKAVAESLGIDPSFDLPHSTIADTVSIGDAPKKHTDNYIQTLLFEDEMQGRLGRLQERVRLSISESGVNPLFCAFGFVEWYDSDNSNIALHAPLLLYQLEISRRMVRGRYLYEIRSTGDRARVNIAFREKLKKLGLGITLPEFDEESDKIESYLQAVAEAIAHQEHWKIRRWVTLGLFSFSRIEMWQDLDPSGWKKGGGLGKNRALERLIFGLNGPTHEDSRPIGADSQINEDFDKLELETPLVADADGSQIAAIKRVLDGKDLVIEGPPGTGKSQTITNLIAASIAGGKKVLFLAEKMAALDVVRKRLADAGLGNFCLELHATKAQRVKVANALKLRLEMQCDSFVHRKLSSLQKQLANQRDLLRQCIDSLASPAGGLNQTVQQLIWRYHSAKADLGCEFEGIDDVRIPHAETFSEADLGNIINIAEELETTRKSLFRSIAVIEECPWYGFADHSMRFVDIDEAISQLRVLKEQLESATSITGQITKLTGCRIDSLDALRRLNAVLGIAFPGNYFSFGLLPSLDDPANIQVLREFCDNLERYSETETRLAEMTGVGSHAGCMDSASLTDLAKHADEAGLKEAPLENLGRLQDSLASDVDSLKSQNETILEIAGILSSPVPPDKPAEVALVNAAALAARAINLPHSEMRPRLTNPGATTLLIAAKQKLESLLSQRANHTGTFALDSLPGAAALRTHAAAYRAAPIWPIRLLSSKWRAARRGFRAIYTGDKKPSNKAAASHLEDLARLVQSQVDFEADRDLRGLLGDCFQGIQTDFSPFIKIARWGDEVRDRLPASNEFQLALRESLVALAPNQMEALALLTRRPTFRAAHGFLAQSAPHSPSVQSAYTDHASRLSHAAAARAIMRERAIPDHLSPPDCRKVAAHLDALSNIQEQIDESLLAQTLLGDDFHGTATDCASIRASIRWAADLHETSVPRGLKTWLLFSDMRERLDTLRRCATNANTLANAINSVVEAIEEIAPVDYQKWLGCDTIWTLSSSDLAQHVQKCLNDGEGLRMLLEYYQRRNDAAEAGLHQLIQLLDGQKSPWKNLKLLTRFIFFRSALIYQIKRHPPLANFSGVHHESCRNQFKGLDVELIRLTRAKLSADLQWRTIEPGNKTGPKRDWTQLALVENEANKQQGHIKIRDLLRRAGTAIQQLMPCFMMSPMSVAQFLEPDQMHFDLVIMDEASQIRPEDAIGAIARAEQVVIVGDPKQLPPTSFFMDRVVADDDGDGMDEQSILEPAMSIIRPVQLKLHYRSRHPSLIAFSNREFYNEELIVFPSPYELNDDYGVRFTSIPGVYSHGANPIEAKMVAESAVEYVTGHLDRSLGIVALNSTQAELISLEVDQLAQRDEIFEKWREKREDSLEPFFVKNLENVQGDERDVIMISTVYGKDENGSFHQRFGPINNEGGHRRLNVLFTRAKFQVIVFSSMDPGDIRVDERTKWGPRALQGYLRYARDGFLEAVAGSSGPPESDFEAKVGEVIRKAGFDPVPQVGVGKYRIDIGIRNPQKPGDYVLGVECDGAAYHSTRSARERDRLRQTHLENLNWRIHRIWSMDWFYNREYEVERLIDAIKEAVSAATNA